METTDIQIIIDLYRKLTRHILNPETEKRTWQYESFNEDFFDLVKYLEHAVDKNLPFWKFAEKIATLEEIRLVHNLFSKYALLMCEILYNHDGREASFGNANMYMKVCEPDFLLYNHIRRIDCLFYVAHKQILKEIGGILHDTLSFDESNTINYYSKPTDWGKHARIETDVHASFICKMEMVIQTREKLASLLEPIIAPYLYEPMLSFNVDGYKTGYLWEGIVDHVQVHPFIYSGGHAISQKLPISDLPAPFFFSRQLSHRVTVNNLRSIDTHNCLYVIGRFLHDEGVNVKYHFHLEELLCYCVAAGILCSVVCGKPRPKLSITKSHKIIFLKSGELPDISMLYNDCIIRPKITKLAPSKLIN
jgi:hypothetical protein